MANKPAVNNQLYDELGERWYTAKDDPIALLRAEARARNPWVLARLSAGLGTGLGEGSRSVLDVGCGGGFVSNALSLAGHSVTAIDNSEESLAVARRHDSTGRVRYQKMDATKLEFEPGVFDAVTMMDFLEHVEEPGRVIAEVSRVLKPGGLFFFSTFNRNPLSGIVVIKGVEWFVKNTPQHLHLYRYFLKPSEVKRHCENAGMKVTEWSGLRPRFLSSALLHLLLKGEVREDFSFTLGRSLLIGYVGVARASVSP